MRKTAQNTEQKLFEDIKKLIEQARWRVGQVANSALTLTYWQIGKRINDELLQNQRAEYGEQIVATVSRQLAEQFGNGFGEKNLRRMVKFAEKFEDFDEVVELSKMLTWSHFVLLLPLKNGLEKDFYAQMCRLESWSVRTLRQKMDSLLFERTAISKKPDELAALEMKGLKVENRLTPDLVFRDPYLLDFLQLKGVFSEKDLESAILREIENFILELGAGFAFVERQKRMVIDGQDFYLDLLFYHRKMRRLVAVELKIGKFKAGFKGQMELYLRWLEKNETEASEENPIGLILCAEGNREQIELLQLGAANIKIAEYITELLPQELLKKKLHQFVEANKRLLANRLDDEKMTDD